MGAVTDGVKDPKSRVGDVVELPLRQIEQSHEPAVSEHGSRQRRVATHHETFCGRIGLK